MVLSGARAEFGTLRHSVWFRCQIPKRVKRNLDPHYRFDPPALSPLPYLHSRVYQRRHQSVFALGLLDSLNC